MATSLDLDEFVSRLNDAADAAISSSSVDEPEYGRLDSCSSSRTSSLNAPALNITNEPTGSGLYSGGADEDDTFEAAATQVIQASGERTQDDSSTLPDVTDWSSVYSSRPVIHNSNYKYRFKVQFKSKFF